VFDRTLGKYGRKGKEGGRLRFPRGGPFSEKPEKKNKRIDLFAGGGRSKQEFPKDERSGTSCEKGGCRYLSVCLGVSGYGIKRVGKRYSHSTF